MNFRELEFDKNQFEFPKQVRVDFSKSRVSFEYEDQGGEQVKTERIKRISLFGVDEAVAKLLEAQGMDIDNLHPLEIWVLDNFSKYQLYQEQGLVKTMELRDFAIVPRWSNGGYRDIALIAKTLKELPNE
ncbi:hypothetical protein [Streptococcus suis]